MKLSKLNFEYFSKTHKGKGASFTKETNPAFLKDCNLLGAL